jgi:hypothetical protein
MVGEGKELASTISVVRDIWRNYEEICYCQG